MAVPSLCLVLIALLSPFVSSIPTSLFERQNMQVPEYVTKYAPLVWLDTKEKYFPSDIAAQLQHTKPQKNFAPVANAPNPLTLDNLDQLNANDGANIWLTSVDDVTKNPSWLTGVKPDASGKTNGATSAAIIVNDRGNNVVDVFYMYFYAFNWGGRFFDSDVGDHVGDWEHNMIRFKNGKPSEVWFSQHSFGEAFTYASLEKQGDRIVAYSGNGSHATYAISGKHDHTIPGFNLPGQGILTDTTSKGTLWDPLLSAYFYTYNPSTKAFTPYDPSYPKAYLSFVGRWGDQQYPDSDPRQHRIFDIDVTARYVGGPTGPIDKQLNRTNVCPTGKPCWVRPFIGA